MKEMDINQNFPDTGEPQDDSRYEVTMDMILSVFKKSTDKKKMKDIKSSVNSLLKPEDLLASPEIDDQVEQIIKDDKKMGDESWLTYSKGYYSKRKHRQAPGELPMQISEYTGRGGECAVMSELLFNNYNVNRMMIDEGENRRIEGKMN